MQNKKIISVGIDVGSSFSFMTIVVPDDLVIQKPFKITHNNLNSLERAVSAIKKVEELYSLESHTFLESTGIYHLPLFRYLVDCGLHVSIINPIITHSSKNGNIRKAKNDKVNSKGIAKLGLSDDIPVSQFLAKLVLEIRSLTRKYYDLTDERAAHINKLKGDLLTVFPQYLDIFCDVTGKTSTMILRPMVRLKKYFVPRKGFSKATERYEKLHATATAAKTFGCQIDSIYFNIFLTLNLIEKLDCILDSIMERIHQLVTVHKNEKFIQQIKLIRTIKGVGFLTAITIMCELGNFAAFRNPKQLFAYFGLDSSKFIGTQMHMSKRGSRITRRAVFAVALTSIRTKRNG